jgi:hypothetical protein
MNVPSPSRWERVGERVKSVKCPLPFIPSRNGEGIVCLDFPAILGYGIKSWTIVLTMKLKF